MYDSLLKIMKLYCRHGIYF